MEQILKRYFWVVQGGVVVVVAALGALAVNNVFAGLMSPWAVQEPGAPSAPASSKGEGSQGGRSLASVTNDAFKPPAKPEDPKADEPKEEEVPPEPEVQPEGEYPRSDLPLTLVGTLVAGNPQWSMAMLQDKSTKVGVTVRTSENVQDGAKLVTVERERIILERNGRLEQIEIDGEGGEAAPGAPGVNPGVKPPFTPSGATGLTPPKPATSASLLGGGAGDKLADFRKGITKLNENAYKVDRSTLQKALDDPSKLRDGAQVLPNYDKGKISGFKVAGLKPNSIFSDLGILSGDIITKVNGRPLNSPNEALKLYQNLSSTGNVTIEVERNGQRVERQYNIQ